MIQGTPFAYKPVWSRTTWHQPTFGGHFDDFRDWTGLRWCHGNYPYMPQRVTPPPISQQIMKKMRHQAFPHRKLKWKYISRAGPPTPQRTVNKRYTPLIYYRYNKWRTVTPRRISALLGTKLWGKYQWIQQQDHAH